MSEETIKLGDMVRDLYSGFEGIAYGITDYLTGCRQVCVVPTTLDKDGKIRDSHWFDVDRLEILPKAKIKSPVTRPGGPQDCPAPTK